jgi:hypothetical protein
MRLPLEAVQLIDALPAALTSIVAPAPPELDCEVPQRFVIAPSLTVNVALDAPLHTASTSQEPAVETDTLVDTALPESTVLVPAAAGALWAAPLNEIEPALTPFTAPPNVTETVFVPDGGLSK